MSPQADRIGEVLLGKLEVKRRIGGGGMGDVYEVEHLLTRHRRALKIVRPEFARQSRFIERLLREAGIAGRLHCPYVVETIDAGRLEDESAYILMEYLEGQSLHHIIATEGGLTQRRLANLMCQVAEGLGVAHAAGIVHRDIKPENVFVVEDEEGFERVKILDFGVSKIIEGVEAQATRLTREGSVLGTPYYMSPEQAAGRVIDERSDIWAVGIVMYEALTERLPFDGKTVGEVLLKIGGGLYVPLATRRPDLDPTFIAIVDRALRSNPEERYQNADALRRDLLPFAGRDSATRQQVPPAQTAAQGETASRRAPETPIPVSSAAETTAKATSIALAPVSPSTDVSEDAASSEGALSVALPTKPILSTKLIWAGLALTLAALAVVSFIDRGTPPVTHPSPSAATVRAVEQHAVARTNFGSEPGRASPAVVPPEANSTAADAETVEAARPASRTVQTQSHSRASPVTRARAAGLEGNPYGLP